MKYWCYTVCWMIVIKIFFVSCKKESGDDIDFPKEIRWNIPKLGIDVDAECSLNHDRLKEINDWCMENLGYKPKVGVARERCPRLGNGSLHHKGFVRKFLSNVWLSNDPILYLKFRTEADFIIFKMWLT